MPSQEVRDPYQRRFFQEFNPQTRQVVIGRTEQVDVALKSITAIYHLSGDILDVHTRSH
jgi:hypothetical protein